ncbi:MAG TPA: TIGR03435 family protein [Bryobacteraceae bacterium]|nr:TIGR03435 family protein [Bryobacteraceae bacterium]
MRVLFYLLFAATAFGQALTFDAASVKPNHLEDHIVSIDVGPGGRFVARGYTLKLLIQQAYEIKGFQILGGASWLDVDRFDISARGRANATRHQVNQMLQSLLAERFGLKLHAVQSEMPGFALEVAVAKPKLTPSQSSEEDQAARHEETGALAGIGFSMPSFAKMVGAYISKPVVDNTGMKGLYDFRIHWTERADQVSEQSDGISLISALRDQLGLKLVSKHVMADLVQIDAASRPTAD